MPAVRLRALKRLADAGIRVGLIVAPVLPGITDDVPHLAALFQAAREAGARFVHAGPLRLYPAVRDRFLPMLETRFPHLIARYRRAYEGRSGVPRARFARLLAIVVSPHGDKIAQTAHGIYRCIPDTATWRKPGQATSLAALPGRDS